MQGDRTGKTELPGQQDRLGQLPAGEVRESVVADLAGPDESVQRAQGLVQRGDRVEQQPENGAYEVNQSGKVKSERPVIGLFYDIPNDDGGDETAKIAHHVHCARECPHVFAAHIHARGPGARHHEVVAKTDEGDRGHREIGIFEESGNHEQAGTGHKSRRAKAAAGSSHAAQPSA